MTRWHAIDRCLARLPKCIRAVRGPSEAQRLGGIVGDVTRELMSSLEELYRSVPPVTRTYVTLAVLTTLGCALEVVSPLKLYLSWGRVPAQPWRLVTNFTFFGASLTLDFIFHVFFLARYSRLLEETTFRGRSADYAWFLLVCGTLLTLAAPFVNVLFMGPSLTFAMVYVWSRRNESVSLSFLGLVNFSAPYLPWLLLLFTVLFGASATVDLLGIAVGHLYYFLSDVYPSLTGRYFLKTPRWFAALFGANDMPQLSGAPTHPEPH